MEAAAGLSEDKRAEAQKVLDFHSKTTTDVVTEESSEAWDAQLDFTRAPFSEVGDCDACSSEAAHTPKTLMLVLEFPSLYLTLCPMHEAELLSKLLRNYLKRVQKKKRGLFPIPKEISCAPCD